MTSTDAWKCDDCGRSNHAAAAFCGRCGVGRPVPVVDSDEFCTSCGASRVPDAPFCAQCGSAFTVSPDATAVMAAPTPAPSVAPTPLRAEVAPLREGPWTDPAAGAVTAPVAAAAAGGASWARSRNGKIAIGVGVALLAIGGGTAGALLFTGGGGDSKKSIGEAIAPVLASQRLVRDAVGSGLSRSTLVQIHSRSTDLMGKIDAATTQVRAMHLSASDLALVEKALANHRSYAAGLAAAGINPATVDPDRFERASIYGDRAVASYEALRTRATIADVPIPSRLGALTAKIKGNQRADLDVKTFVDRTERLLEESTNGRGEIASTIAATERCSLTPEDAGRRIYSVADNRQSVLDQISGVNPPTPATQRIMDTLQLALTHSREADRHYAQWIANQTSWYYASPVGCPTGQMPRDSYHAQASSESGSATDAKARFVAMFNPLARTYHRREWSEGQI